MGRKIRQRKELRAPAMAGQVMSYELRAISKNATKGSLLAARGWLFSPVCEMILRISTSLSRIFVFCSLLTLNCLYGLFVIN